MASETPTRILESPSIIHVEIDRRLEEDGLSTECSHEEKLLYIWRLFQNAEVDLQAAIEKEEKLKVSQAEEMQEVENYVEHIRHLSDEREALIQELETENDQLKQDIERYRQEQNASTLRDETAEMLIQQGLEEIAQAPTSEQIAFLLVERARLLDELEAEQVRSQSAISDGRLSEDLQRTIDREREELQEEMEQQRTLSRNEVEQLRREHEEEISVVMEENTRLEEELTSVRDKVQGLETKLKKVEDELKKEKEAHEKEKEGFVSPEIYSQFISSLVSSDSGQGTVTEEPSTPPLSPFLNSLISPRNPRASPRQRPPSPARSPSDVALRQIIAEKTKLEGEILGYKQKIRSFEGEIDTLKGKLSKIEKDNEELQMKNSQLQMKNKGLKSELEEAEQQLDESEGQIDELKKQRDNLKNSLDTLSSEYSTLQTESQKSSQLVERLNDQNQDLCDQMESLKHEMDEIIVEKDELVTQKLQLSKSEIELSNEIQELKSELNLMKSAKDDYNIKITELQQTQSMLDTKTLEFDKLTTDTELLNKENKDLLNRLEALQSELETTRIDKQGFAKQELIMGHMRDQNAKLSKEVEELKQKLKKKEVEYADLEAKLKKETEDLKAKLQLALTELTKAKTVVEQERSENSDLTNRVMELEHMLDDMSKTCDSKDLNMTEMEEKVKELEKMLTEKSVIEEELEESKRRTSQLEGDIGELEGLRIELEDSRDMLEQEQRSKTQLERKLQELEQILDDQKMDSENIQQTLTAKVKTLENRVQALQDDLFAAQDELQAVQEKYEESLKQKANAKETALEEAKASQIELEEKLVKEEQKSLHLARQEETTLATQRLEQNKLENLEKQMESLKSRLAESQNQTETITRERDSLQKDLQYLQETLAKISKQTNDNETMRIELDSVRRELEHLRLSAEYDGEERQQHLDKIRTLEDYTRQLELDNRELANKLQETLVKYEQTEENLHKERRGTVDRQQQSNRQLHQVEAELDSANNKIRELRDEVQKKQNQLIRQEADKVGHSAKSESTIARLEAELNELKIYHRKELDKLNHKADQATKEAKELRNQLREKEQELLSKQHEGKRTKTQTDRLEAQLQTEMKIRTDLENRNTALDQEISKVWGQVRTLMEKNASLETTKRNLEDELERKSNSIRQAESTYSQAKASHETATKALQGRADTAEKRADAFQRELQETSRKLQSVQAQVYQAENSKLDLQDKKDKVTTLKNQLDGEKLQRSLLDQTVKELQQQVSMMRQREAKVLEQNRELQHTIIDLESKLEEIQDRNQTAFEMDGSSSSLVNKLNSLNQIGDTKQQHMSEVGKRSMMEQILRLQKDIKDLQYELLTVNERREILDRKYEERKIRTKAKLLKAREFYTKEKARVQDQLNRMDEDLRLTRATLRKELDWKDRMDSNYKQLITEKRELLTQLNEQEENLREKGRMISILQVRTKFLEEENSRLQDRIDSVTQQKHGLDKLLKEQKMGKERESSFLRAVSPGDNAHSITMATSGLGTSINSNWESDNILHFRNQSDAGTNGYLGNSFTGGSIGDSIDLFREKDTASESSFDGDAFDS